MGQAKKRGTKEQRIRDSLETKIPSMGKMSEAINVPVDEDLFLFCSNLYSAAAHLRMPVENPGSRPLFIDEGKSYAFSDIPVNRGMLAVMKELREQGIDEEVRMSMTWRIMHFGDVLREQTRFSKWIRIGEEDGAVDVAESLIRACAIAKMTRSDEGGSFNFDDVERLATEITTRLEATPVESK